MAISSIETVVPTVNEFIAHWSSVNAALGATPLLLPSSYALATLTTDRDALVAFNTAIVVADNARQTAAADRDIKRGLLRERIRQLRATIIGRAAGTVFPRALPKLPRADAKEQDFLKALDDAKDVWTRLNAAPPSGFVGPLLMVGPYPVAQFTADITALRTAFTLVSTNDVSASFARKQRDQLISTIRPKLSQYRQAVAGVFAAGNPLITSLPALTPPAGSTPAAVNLSGVWVTLTSEAQLTWSASDNPDLDHYSVRYHPGPRYKAAEEQSVDVVPAGIETFATDYGLAAPGSISWYKVYVVTSTGNEKGSNAVKVIRT